MSLPSSKPPAQSFDWESYHILILAGIILLSLMWAINHIFLVDDAFINLRFAKNFATGHGLVFNPGEQVEGYTNFLYILIVSIPFFLDIDPLNFMHLYNMLTYIGVLIVSYAIGRVVFKHRGWALAATALIGMNPSMASYASSGMETMQFALIHSLLLLITLRILYGEWATLPAMLGFSVLGALLVLTRPDGAMPAGIMGLVLLWKVRPQRGTLLSMAALAGPALAILVPWLTWKYSFYGTIVPNTYWAKNQFVSQLNGLWFVYSFLYSYLLLPVVIMAVFALPAIFKKRQSAMLLLMTLIAFWWAYCIKVGGDFMEFRFMIAIIPMVMIIAMWLLRHYDIRRWVSITVLVILLLGNVHHELLFGQTRNEDMQETTEMMNDNLWDHRHFIRIGKALGVTLGNHPDVTIAVTAAGAIPYYSGLYAIDMYGLTDRWIAIHGDPVGYIPGHQRYATYPYLLKRKVNLVLGPLVVRPITEPPLRYFTMENLRFFGPLLKDPAIIPQDAKVLEMPIDRKHKLEMLYLLPHPAVEEAIKEFGWRVVPLRPPTNPPD